MARRELRKLKMLDIEVRVKYRLQSELMALMMSRDSGISAFPEEDNIFCWKRTITGSSNYVKIPVLSYLINTKYKAWAWQEMKACQKNVPIDPKKRDDRATGTLADVTLSKMCR
ncbi:hypothetical protein Ahy_A07g035039 isoform A [Arachis hypogaea]|uniref:Uncharacterized protein n=1 Tax=Arachis hypogaea TaxID=3818 RepID=A0A445CD98_ARAHY|nr:hypothetical protein Ahy_A07g035039 isoform A [Arachis hypogaea]